VTDSAPLDKTAARAEKTGCLGGVAFAAVLLAVVAAALAFAMIRWRAAVPRALTRPAVGQRLPRLQLQPLTGGGKPVGLDGLAGRIVLLNFWGTWCPACLAELPDMAWIAEKFRNRPDFSFLAVSCGQTLPEDLGQLRLDTTTLLFSEHIPMPTYADPGGITRRSVDRIVGLKTLPLTLILDRGGVIRGVWVGRASKGELEELIGQLLEEQ
jgi:cytochrome c biogenesis protein CcmG/thiol:disulfide interchange protein DsbE